MSANPQAWRWWWPLFPFWTPDPGHVRENRRVRIDLYYDKPGMQIELPGERWDRQDVTYVLPRYEAADVAERLYPGNPWNPPWPAILGELLGALSWPDVQRMSCYEALNAVDAQRRCASLPAQARMASCLTQVQPVAQPAISSMQAELIQHKVLCEVRKLLVKSESAPEAAGSAPEAAQAEPSEETHPRGLTADEFNVLARDYLAKHAPDHRVTARELAEYLKGQNPAGTCSTGTVAKLPAYRAYHDELRRQGHKGRKQKPKAVALCDVEHVVSERDAELERLIEQQTEDFEPSPLDADPPDRPRHVRAEKRV